jgi:hypothetical protein
MDRESVGVHHHVNLAGQAPRWSGASRAAHVLMIVVRDTSLVLVHAHDRCIDHLRNQIPFWA